MTEIIDMENKDVLKEYEKYKTEINPVKPKTKKTQLGRIRVFGNNINKSYRDATETDVLHHLERFKPSSRNAILISIKSFYKWLYGLDKNDKLPDCVRRIQPLKIEHDEVKRRECIVTDGEYQKLIDNAYTPMHKAMLETLYTFGIRATELLSINSDDVTYDGKLTRITVRTSKTETRDVIHKNRCNCLMTYVESYQPFKDQPGKPLFIGYKQNRYTIDGLEQFITSLCKKLDLKHITPHDFRHTSISRDRANGVPITHIETKHGLVHGSQVMKIYDHNRTKDYEDWLNGKTTETEETYDALKHKNVQLEKLESLNTHWTNKVNNLEKQIQDIVHRREQELEKAELTDMTNKEYTKEYAKANPKEYQKLIKQVKRLNEKLGFKTIS